MLSNLRNSVEIYCEMWVISNFITPGEFKCLNNPKLMNVKSGFTWRSLCIPMVLKNKQWVGITILKGRYNFRLLTVCRSLSNFAIEVREEAKVVEMAPVEECDHEMIHLLWCHHNERFIVYMNRLMLLWQFGSGLTETDIWYHARSFQKAKGPRMIAIRCRRCDSANLRKNGHTPSGQQKFHCKDCNAYGTLDTKEQERAHKQATVEKLHLERLSQRAIARTTGMSRMTVAAILKKKP